MISVIMLTYNRQNVVTNMIEDIIGQTYRDYEFLIIDNGSTDGTPDIIRRYSEVDKRIKIITIPISSIGGARNIGLRHAKGEYVAYVDDDDRVEADFLEFLMNLIEENGADISMCGASEGDGQTRQPQCLFDEKLILTGTEAVKLLIGRKYIRNGTATKLYKKEILEKFPFVENYRNEDLHTQYKYLLEANKVVIHGIDKYYVTRHQGNVSGFTSDPSKWDAQIIQDYLDAYHNRTAYIKDNAPGIYELARYSEWSFMISMVDKIHHYTIPECELLNNILCKELKKNSDDFLSSVEIQPFEVGWMNTYVL